MAMVCGDCRTENRDGAKFCKGCGRRLVALAAAETKHTAQEDWPETQRMPLPPAARAGSNSAVPSRKAVSMPAAHSPPTSFRSPSRAPTAARPSKGSRKGPAHRSYVLRIGALTLLAAAALLTAAGAWYISSKRAAETPLPATVVSAPPAPVEVAPALMAPAAPVVEAPAAPIGAVGPAAESSPVSAGAPIEEARPAPAAAPAKVIRAVAPKPRSLAAVPAPSLPPTTPIVVAPLPVSTPAPALEPVGPVSPQTACAGLNYFARAQCMATQCTKAEYKAHSQCDAVRRQQRIDEEKRNPSLLN